MGFEIVTVFLFAVLLQNAIVNAKPINCGCGCGGGLPIGGGFGGGLPIGGGFGCSSPPIFVPPRPPCQSVTIPSIIFALLPPNNRPICRPRPIIRPPPTIVPIPQPYPLPIVSGCGNDGFPGPISGGGGGCGCGC